jgi:hypothetical protein
MDAEYLSWNDLGHCVWMCVTLCFSCHRHLSFIKQTEPINLPGLIKCQRWSNLKMKTSWYSLCTFCYSIKYHFIRHLSPHVTSGYIGCSSTIKLLLSSNCILVFTVRNWCYWSVACWVNIVLIVIGSILTLSLVTKFPFPPSLPPPRPISNIAVGSTTEQIMSSPENNLFAHTYQVNRAVTRLSPTAGCAIYML